MEFGIFNLMGAREADKPTAQVFGEVAEQTRLADELGYATAWFAEHHFSQLLPVRIAADDGGALRGNHQEDPSRYRRCGIAALQPGAACRRGRHRRRAIERAAEAGHRRGLRALRVRAFRRRPRAEPRNDRRIRRDPRPRVEPGFFHLRGQALPDARDHIPARPVQKPLPIYVAGHTPAMFRAAARRGYRVMSSGRAGGANCSPSNMPTSPRRLLPKTYLWRARTSRSTAFRMSPAAGGGDALAENARYSRGSPPACGGARRSCAAHNWSTCRFRTSRRSRRSATIC